MPFVLWRIVLFVNEAITINIDVCDCHKSTFMQQKQQQLKHSKKWCIVQKNKSLHIGKMIVKFPHQNGVLSKSTSHHAHNWQ